MEGATFKAVIGFFLPAAVLWVGGGSWRVQSEWISVHVLCGCEWASAHVLTVIASPLLCFFGSRIHVVSSQHFHAHVLCGLFMILPFLAKAAVICVRGPPLSGHALAWNSLFVPNAWRESMDSSIHDPRSQ